MPVNLKNIPGTSVRPSPPKPLRWLTALACLLATGILLMRFLGKLVGNDTFWWFAIGVPLALWAVIAFLRLTVYGLRHMRANAYDKHREEHILKEVRQGRRALQILFADCVTAHTSGGHQENNIGALLSGENQLFPQTAWDNSSHVRHSRLPVVEGQSQESGVTAAFTALLQKLSEPLSTLQPDNPVAILLESSSSLPDEKIKVLWSQAWQESEMPQPTAFVTGYGLAAVDHWLDHRINENTLLLVVALQIAPEQPEMTAEAVTGLLLGNRLTQKILTPLALLHRPESSSAKAEALQEAVVQAADWVPLLPDAVSHLWLSGLDEKSDAWSSAITVQGKPPLTRINPDSGLHDFNTYLGHPGRAAPWLAIAAAAQAISGAPAPHMIISGEQGSDTVWSTVVSPHASRKENDS